MLLIEEAKCKLNGEEFFGVKIEYDNYYKLFTIETEEDKSNIVIHIDDIELAIFENKEEIVYVEESRIRKYDFLETYMKKCGF